MAADAVPVDDRWANQRITHFIALDDFLLTFRVAQSDLISLNLSNGEGPLGRRRSVAGSGALSGFVDIVVARGQCREKREDEDVLFHKLPLEIKVQEQGEKVFRKADGLRIAAQLVLANEFEMRSWEEL